MPGVCCTVGEQIAALRRVAGDKVVGAHPPEAGRADHEDRRGLAEPLRRRARARELGFKVENTFDEIIRVHIDENCGGKIVA